MSKHKQKRKIPVQELPPHPTDEQIEEYLLSISQNHITIKEKFKERYKTLTDYSAFMHCSLQFLTRAIRINTLKISVQEAQELLADRFLLKPVPWCKEGFWIEHKTGRRDIGNTPEHSLGYVYIQEPASMIPPLVLDPKPGEIVLDLCAAPGSKTTQIAMYMQNKGVIVANDYKIDRLKPLAMNVQRVGATNVIITLNKGHRVKGLEFDKILVDAPCSGTGTIRKSLKTLQMWNPNMIRRIAAQQKQLLGTAWQMLKPGGVLVYSTCSLEPDENEAVVHWLLAKESNAQLMPIELQIKRSAAVLSFEGEQFHPSIQHCLRIWPQDNDTEGFFVAKLVKTK